MKIATTILAIAMAFAPPAFAAPGHDNLRDGCGQCGGDNGRPRARPSNLVSDKGNTTRDLRGGKAYMNYGGDPYANYNPNANNDDN